MRRREFIALAGDVAACGACPAPRQATEYRIPRRGSYRLCTLDGCFCGAFT